MRIDKKYNGIYVRDVNGLLEDSGLMELLEADPVFKKEAMFRFQILIAASFLRISIYDMDSAIHLYNIGQSLRERFEQQFGPDVLPMVKTDMIRNFRDKPNDIDLFRAYVSIKSLIGRKKFTLSDKPTIKGRMFGCKTLESFEYFTEHIGKEKYFSLKLIKYKKRGQMNKLLCTLRDNNFIMFLSKKNLNKIYLSTQMEPEALLKLIDESKEMKQRIKDASARL